MFCLQGLVFFYMLTYFVGYGFWKFYIYDHFAFAESFEVGFYGMRW